MLDIENSLLSLDDLNKKLLRLHDRFLAIAMDYKFYINSNLNDGEIYKLRDNVIFRLKSAKFHYKLLIEYHTRIENNVKSLQKKAPPIIFIAYERNSSEEIYSLFDSLIYHLCSNFDYLFRLVNFIHGKTELSQPKWNLFKHDKNIKQNLYCSDELIEKLKVIDENFVYPLYRHRSFLIHNEFDVGHLVEFNDSTSKFVISEVLKNHFPELTNNFRNNDVTLMYAGKWLIDKTFQAITEVLFALKEDIIKNKVETQPIFHIIDSNNKMQSPSINFWGLKDEI